MRKIERTTDPIDSARSQQLGVGKQANKELQAFIKDKTSGLAASIVRNNKSGLALESWRLLWATYSPVTLTSTMQAQQMEKFPKPAKSMADLPACLIAWEKSLQRCTEEGRTLPSDEEKRLALLRLLPSKQRQALWDTADQLFPTYSALHAKIHRMLQDEHDSKLGLAPMDLDNLETDT